MKWKKEEDRDRQRRARRKGEKKNEAGEKGRVRGPLMRRRRAAGIISRISIHASV